MSVDAGKYRIIIFIGISIVLFIGFGLFHYLNVINFNRFQIWRIKNKSLIAFNMNYSNLSISQNIASLQNYSTSNNPVNPKPESNLKVYSLPVGRNEEINENLFKSETKSKKVSVLVLYAYHEAPWRAENLKFLMNKILFPPEKMEIFDFEYIFIINDFVLSVEIPQYKNVHIIKRENLGFDLCAWKTAIEYSIKQLNKTYSYYIFMNASVRGPFIPNYIKYTEWILPFLLMLNGQVKLVGTICQCGGVPIHIPGMFTMTDSIGFKIISPLLSCEYREKWHAIWHGELTWSRKIIENGYNIACLSIWWRDWDFRNQNATQKKCKEWKSFGTTDGDNYFPGQYDGGDLYPLEMIFFKTNRNIRDTDVKHLTKIYQKQHP